MISPRHLRPEASVSPVKTASSPLFLAATDAACPLCKQNCADPILRHLRGTIASVRRCRSCGLQFLVPQPDGETLRQMYAARYFDSWAMYSGDRPEIAAMKEDTFTRHLKHLTQLVSPGAILDVGTATGFFLHAARRFGFDPYGIELSDYAAQIAIAKFGAERIHHGTIETCSFPYDSFTAITMFDLLEHVPDPLGALRKAHDLLRRGGVVAIVTPNTGSVTRRLMRSSWPHYKLEHLSYWNPSTLCCAATKAGFSVERIVPAVKIMAARYMRAQLAVYPNTLLGPITALLARWQRTAHARFPLRMGEMTAYLRKRTG